MTNIISFLREITGISGRYEFLLYVFAGVLVLILLDGILTFLFSGISDLTSRR